MTLKEIAVEEFTNFVKESPLGTYYQTREYALLMGNYGYDYDFIGMYDEYSNLKAASLILIKKVRNLKYGYAPRGFIIDYFNKELVTEFMCELIKYYKKKKIPCNFLVEQIQYFEYIVRFFDTFQVHVMYISYLHHLPIREVYFLLEM